MSTDFKKGDRVSFRTTGRAPTNVIGNVVSIEDRGPGRGGGAWATIKDDAGKDRLTRLGGLAAA
jgi:hypothetical protein